MSCSCAGSSCLISKLVRPGYISASSSAVKVSYNLRPIRAFLCLLRASWPSFSNASLVFNLLLCTGPFSNRTGSDVTTNRYRPSRSFSTFGVGASSPIACLTFDPAACLRFVPFTPVLRAELARKFALVLRVGSETWREITVNGLRRKPQSIVLGEVLRINEFGETEGITEVV